MPLAYLMDVVTLWTALGDAMHLAALRPGLYHDAHQSIRQSTEPFEQQPVDSACDADRRRNPLV